VPATVDLSDDEASAAPAQASFFFQFSRGFWTFFAAAFLFDFGIGLYFFLFNLFLTDLHFNERTLGLITGALTLGNVAGTIPAMLLVRRFGLQRLLQFCFVATPFICAIRTLILWTPAQIGLAFLTGVAMCSWPICFSPTIARLTDDRNRVRGFSLMFATGIGLGSLAGVAGGYLPELLQHAQNAQTVVWGIRAVLWIACGAVLLGSIPIARLRLEHKAQPAGKRLRFFHPFLLWFLPPFVVWNVVTGSFPPFAAVYLQQHLHIALRNVGVVFAESQLAQFAAVLLAPFVFRRMGLIPGIACSQAATGLVLFWMASTHNPALAVATYLGYTSLQWMSGPGIYSFLMNNIPDEERGTASAIQNMSGAICQAATAAVTGACIVRFGYPTVLVGNGGVALVAALLFALLLGFAFKKGSSTDFTSNTSSPAS
jgi:MFS family permease